MTTTKDRRSGPMPHTEAPHLLNPLRGFFFSPGRLLRHLGLTKESHVLELGPGPGYFSPAVARAIPKGRLVLVDVQEEMLDMARKRLARRGIANVEFRKGEAGSLPVESCSFDAVFLVAVLGEVADRGACLREIRRVLRPEGVLTITEMKLGDPDSIPANELLKSVEAAGFWCHSLDDAWFSHTLDFKKTPSSSICRTSGDCLAGPRSVAA